MAETCLGLWSTEIWKGRVTYKIWADPQTLTGYWLGPILAHQVGWDSVGKILPETVTGLASQ